MNLGRGWKPDFMAYWVVAAAFRSMGNVADEVKVLKMKRKLGVAPRSSDYLVVVVVDPQLVVV